MFKLYWVKLSFPGGSDSKESACNVVQSMGLEDPLEKGMTIHSRNEIKRHLLLGRKVMTNLDSILKSRDITLSTKVRLVKDMVFPVIMYGYESWTARKAEH